MLAELAHHFPPPLPEIHLKLLWYAAFGLEVDGLADAKPAVEARFLEWLLTNPLAVRLLPHTGVRVRHITLDADLNLHTATLNFPVVIADSKLRRIILTDATTRSISFDGSECDTINAARITINGSLSLTNVHAQGPVDLTGAKISADLDCSGGDFKAPGDPAARKLAPWALKTSSAKVHGSILLSDTSNNRPFNADGQILAVEMTLGGDFDCTNATITNTIDDRHAISLDRSRIHGSVVLRNGFSATGEVRLIGTRISNDLDCSGGTFRNNKDGGKENEDGTRRTRVALEARNSHINHCVYLGGRLNGSQHFGKKQTSSEQAAAVGSFLTDGLICFDFAHIGCDLFIGKHDDNDDIINKGDETPVEKTRTQLNTDRINIRNTEVGGSMRCMADFSGVKLYLDNTTVDALSVPNEKKFWPIYSRRRFSYNCIHFLDVKNDSRCQDINYLEWLNREAPPHCPFDPQIHEQLATVLSRSGEEIAAKIILIDKEDRRRKNIVEALRDEAIKSGGGSVGRRVSLWGSAVWSAILQRSMKHGYKPSYLVWWSGLIVLVGWLFFFVGNQARLIVPTEKLDFNNAIAASETDKANLRAFLNNPHCKHTAREWQTEKRTLLRTYYPTFDPFIYSLEVVLPVVRFGQQAYWQPDDFGCGIPEDAAGRQRDASVNTSDGPQWSPITFGAIFGDFLRWWSWFEAAAGWLCVSLVAVALTALIPKSSGKA